MGWTNFYVERHVRMRKKYWVYHEGLRGKPPTVPRKNYEIQEEEEEDVTKKLDSCNICKKKFYGWRKIEKYPPKRIALKNLCHA